VFPEFKGVFGDLYSKVSLHVSLEFPTAESVLAVTETKLAERVAHQVVRSVGQQIEQ